MSGKKNYFFRYLKRFIFSFYILNNIDILNDTVSDPWKGTVLTSDTAKKERKKRKRKKIPKKYI